MMELTAALADLAERVKYRIMQMADVTIRITEKAL
jgi:hypothetical protein